MPSPDDPIDPVVPPDWRDAEFDAAELAELDRRLAEPKPQYASLDEIEALLGKPFAKS